MVMTQQIQPPRKRCNRCLKLKLMDDYGLKKNKGQFMTCITCRRRSHALKDKVMKLRTPNRKQRPRRGLIIDKTLKSLIASIIGLKLK